MVFAFNRIYFMPDESISGFIAESKINHLNNL